MATDVVAVFLVAERDGPQLGASLRRPPQPPPPPSRSPAMQMVAPPLVRVPPLLQAPTLTLPAADDVFGDASRLSPPRVFEEKKGEGKGEGVAEGDVEGEKGGEVGGGGEKREERGGDEGAAAAGNQACWVA